MLTKPFENSISKATEAHLREAFLLMLRTHAYPVYGAARTIEHAVAGLNALEVLGNIKANADEFELAENLRVTESKAKRQRSDHYNVIHSARAVMRGKQITDKCNDGYIQFHHCVKL